MHRGPNVAIAAILLTACSGGVFGNGSDAVRPSGTVAERRFAIDGFDAVSVAGAEDVEVRTGTGFSVVARGDAAILDVLDIRREGRTLRIGRKPNMRVDGDADTRVTVTMPALTAVALAGAGDVSVDRVRGDALSLSLAGAGDLSVGQIAVREARVEQAGSGDVTLAGTAERMTVAMAGSGDLGAPRLTAKAASVSVIGSGNVRFDVDGPAEVSVAGAGDVDLGARARCTITKAGAGDVRCGGGR